MKIESLKDLEKVIKLCRKLGVEVIKVDGVELVLGHMATPSPQRSWTAPKVSLAAYPPNGITSDTKIITDELTPEQMLFYSADPSVMEGEQQ